MASGHLETTEERVTRLIPGKRYLGDGAYVQSAGWSTSINLTAENGVDVLHEIMLEPAVWRALLGYMIDLEAGVRALATEQEAPPAAEEKTT